MIVGAAIASGERARQKALVERNASQSADASRRDPGGGFGSESLVRTCDLPWNLQSSSFKQRRALPDAPFGRPACRHVVPAHVARLTRRELQGTTAASGGCGLFGGRRVRVGTLRDGAVRRRDLQGSMRRQRFELPERPAMQRSRGGLRRVLRARSAPGVSLRGPEADDVEHARGCVLRSPRARFRNDV